MMSQTDEGRQHATRLCTFASDFVLFRATLFVSDDSGTCGMCRNVSDGAEPPVRTEIQLATTAPEQAATTMLKHPRSRPIIGERLRALRRAEQLFRQNWLPGARAS
jgi:hypothetical protein